MLQSMGSQRVGHDQETELNSLQRRVVFASARFGVTANSESL